MLRCYNSRKQTTPVRYEVTFEEDHRQDRTTWLSRATYFADGFGPVRFIMAVKKTF